MNEITLVIPAKEEPNALPMVLNEIKKMNLGVNILIIIGKEDVKTLGYKRFQL